MLRPIKAMKKFWEAGGVLGLATGKQMMFDFYVKHGYPEEQMSIFNPEEISPEPDAPSSKEAAIQKVKNVATAENLKDRADLWMGVDVLTGITYQDPFMTGSDPDWKFYLKADRSLCPDNPEHVDTFTKELKDRYDREFWSLWQLTWVMGTAGNQTLASLSLSVIGHYPKGIPKRTIQRALTKNPRLAFKIGPGIDLASQYKARGEGLARVVSADGGEEIGFENKHIGADWLVSLVVFRYLTQHQVGSLITQFERQSV